MDEKYWYLKNCALFERLSPEQSARLEQRSQSKRFGRGGLIYVPSDAGESVLLVMSGRVKIYHLTGDGKQALLALIEPGELFGELALFDGGQREEFAEAMDATTVLRIPADEIRRLMELHPGVSLGVTKLMGLRRRRVERRLKSLLFRSNRERLIHLLLELVGQYGRRTSEGVEIGLKLSHQELASIIGSTRETVTVVLGELKSEGSLIIKRRQIVLLQMERLAQSLDVVPPNVSSGRIPRPVIGRPARQGLS
ncbi:MAG: Crp/Fnr family transcriptional regulator [Planctomycetaceae bacterium]